MTIFSQIVGTYIIRETLSVKFSNFFDFIGNVLETFLLYQRKLQTFVAAIRNEVFLISL